MFNLNPSKKFDNLVKEMLGSETSSETELIRSIHQNLTQSGSRLENLKYQFSEQRNHRKAAAATDALIAIDKARKILFDLQD